MPDFDAGVTLADRMRAHAADHQHLYGHLMRAMADDWEAGGPIREICRGWEDAPSGSVVQLRLLAGLFRIVLTNRAPELVPFYPYCGGTAPPEDAWPDAREVIAAHVDELHAGLEIAPQTNEVARSTALLVGLFEVVRRTGLRRVRILEPGASAGLNLLVDKFRFVNQGWAFGPENSALVLQDGVVGDVRPEDFEVVSRRGCDVAPVNAATPEGQLRLRSFVWPFQLERHERLTAALRVAAANSVTVDRGGAGQWVEQHLSRHVDDDVVTVVWQSITRMYWPTEESARVESAVNSAAARLPVAHVAMEYPAQGSQQGAELTIDRLRLGDSQRQGGPVTAAPRRVIAKVGDHGTPVTLTP